MCSKGLMFFALLSIISSSFVVLCQNNNEYERMPVLPPPRRPPPEISNNNLERGWGQGFMKSAQTFVASPAGQMVVSMAKEMVARSYGGNQVLSLNMTSLLILVLLKALIFTTGLLGGGNWSQYGRGRVLNDNNSLVSNAEMQLYLGFLAAEGSAKDSCLYRAACMAPEQSSEYLKAGRALLEGYGIFDPSVPRNQRYNEYLQNFHRAVLEGMQNAPCDMIYHCNI